jgi:hypothetical protein
MCGAKRKSEIHHQRKLSPDSHDSLTAMLSRFMNHIIEKLFALEKGKYETLNRDVELSLSISGRRFSDEQLNLLEKKYNTKFPDEYKTLMIAIGEFWLESELGEYFETIGLFGFNEIYNDKLIPITGLDADHKNVFPIGTDGGGSQYFYDLTNTSGCGKFSVLLVDSGYCVWDDCVFEGVSLADVLERMLTGSGLPKSYRLSDRK